MKNKLSVLIGGLLIALLVIGVAGATSAFAQSEPSDTLHGRGPGGGRGSHLGTAELEAAAKVLDMTADELSSALESGKTLEEIAEDAGVDYAKVQAAVQEAHKAEMSERIQQAVEDGTITQENADWLLEGLEKGFLGAPGGFKLGGPHGLRPDTAPTAQPAPTSGS